ncbi:proline racemase family protein [Peristeroidobacter agariperforans]|uniref:proline racemase family protein n=1 Tax=Peristeroidobacter agariperforans TaxID=268404 RepID=UPI00101D0D0D|nr:proline racemase family protein [Peristeroidobacter agariperforans]
MSFIFDRWRWQPPAHFQRITTLEMHTGGEPLRIFTSGLPELPGETVLDKRRYFRDHFDHLRTATMWEPRGHSDMYGAVITPSRDADLDVFFLHNEGYSTMCGHAIIAITTLAFETALIERSGERRELSLNVPAGRIHAIAHMDGERVRYVSFRNVPSFVYRRDQHVDVPGLGRVRFDIAYGGAFYAIVEAAPLDLTLEPREFNRLIDLGRRIKHAVMASVPVEHPFETDLGFLYGTIFTGPAQEPGHHSRNVCIFADGEVDRSATGSGVSARAALHYARGELTLGTPITIESILGSTMTVRVAEATPFGPHAAIIPEVSGTAHITGRNELYLNPDDPLGRGFNFR